MANLELATIGGGCFWCLEAFYQRIKGVKRVVSGFAGGHDNKPDYMKLHNSDTGHAEVVQIAFDSAVISYREILEIFFTMHDPTTRDRQGNDVGAEYRSIILYHDEDQRKTAEDMMINFAPTIWKDPIVTELKPYDKFYPAGGYHQNFYENNPGNGYCQVVINPKLDKLREKFKEFLV